MRSVVPLFDCVESVDRLSLARELSRRCEALDRTLEVLLQVDTSGEQTKGGSRPRAADGTAPRDRRAATTARGGVDDDPGAAPDPETVRPAFARLRSLRAALAAEPGGR